MAIIKVNEFLDTAMCVRDAEILKGKRCRNFKG